jgi:ribosome-associated translation inhibitor RaiA
VSGRLAEVGAVLAPSRGSGIQANRTSVIASGMTHASLSMRRNHGARNEATMSKSDDRQRITFRENVIHVGVGFAAKERPHVREALSTLASHLGRWDPRDVDVEVTLQDRGGKEQRVTLRTMLPGLPQLIAVAESPDITRALIEAKRELIRQLEHQKSAGEPMNNRGLRRATIRRGADTRHFELNQRPANADR